MGYQKTSKQTVKYFEGFKSDFITFTFSIFSKFVIVGYKFSRTTNIYCLSKKNRYCYRTSKGKTPKSQSIIYRKNKTMDTFSLADTLKLEKNKWLLALNVSEIIFLFLEQLKNFSVFPS